MTASNSNEMIATHAKMIIDSVAKTKADHIFVVSRDGKVLDKIDEIIGRDKIVRSVRGSIDLEYAIRELELLKSDVSGGKKRGVSTLQIDVTRVSFAEQTSENSGQTAIMIFAELRGLTQLTKEGGSVNTPNRLPAPAGEPAVLLLPDINRDASLTEEQREWLRALPPEKQRKALYDILRKLDAQE